jgi:hypothetical protein
MVNPFRRNSESDEPPLSDEEIEATYFPGTAPVFPDPTLAQLESLRFTDEGWESAASGIVFVIAGGSEQPDTAKLALAREIVIRFAEVEEASKQVARNFIRDEGNWSVEEVNVSRSAIANQCDFQVCLSFSSADGSAKYGYTSFTVCFMASSSPKRTAFHVRRHVIEFL